jgi:hypothetical protein
VDPGDELVDVVDEANEVVRVVSRRELRARNLLHRCTYVFVLKALLSRRSRGVRALA